MIAIRAFVALVVIAFVANLFDRPESSNDRKPTRLQSAREASTTRVTRTSSPEALLASIDAGSDLVSKTTIGKYRYWLQRLAGKCPEDEGQIADMVSRDLLSEKGKRRMLKEMLQLIDTAIPPEAAGIGVTCAEVGAALVALTG